MECNGSAGMLVSWVGKSDVCPVFMFSFSLVINSPPCSGTKLPANAHRAVSLGLNSPTTSRKGWRLCHSLFPSLVLFTAETLSTCRYSLSHCSSGQNPSFNAVLQCAQLNDDSCCPLWLLGMPVEVAVSGKAP